LMHFHSGAPMHFHSGVDMLTSRKLEGNPYET